jgi:hypothetical protein
LPAAADDRRPSRLLRRLLAWWRRLGHRTRLGLLLGVATAAVLIPLATTQLAFDEAGASAVPDQTTPDSATRIALARRFAPVLRLDGRELLVPISVESYLSASDLIERQGRARIVAKSSPTPDDLDRDGDCLTAQPACTFNLDVRRANPPFVRPEAYARIQNRLLGEGAPRVVYAHVTQYDDGGDYAIQYWFLYVFNYRLNLHESDWEQITIHLDSDRQPIEAFYSSHESGQKRVWARMEKDGEHPFDFVAQGSHANYFKPGTPPVTLRCTPVRKRLKVCVKNRTVHDVANGRRVLRPGRDYRVREFPGTPFVGGWGSGNFVAGKQTTDVVSDPRLRSAWADPLSRFDRAKLVAKL